MENCSLNNESLIVEPEKAYYIIDGLYINSIKNEWDELNLADLENEIREKVFPYTDTPFGIFIPHEGELRISSIKKMDEDEEPTVSSFSCDTGLLVVVRKDIFADFIQVFDYESVVDSSIDRINMKYWNAIANKYEIGTIGLILAPGIDSGYDFDGSGVYSLEVDG